MAWCSQIAAVAKESCRCTLLASLRFIRLIKTEDPTPDWAIDWARRRWKAVEAQSGAVSPSRRTGDC